MLIGTGSLRDRSDSTGRFTIARVPISTPDRLDYRVTSPPSECLRHIYNGEDPRFNGNVLRVAEDHLVPQDVVAIEYYRYAEDIPTAYRRFAWPPVDSGVAPCSLIVYWLRIAEKPVRRR